MLSIEIVPPEVTSSGFGTNMPVQSSLPALSRSCADWLASIAMYWTFLTAGTPSSRKFSFATSVYEESLVPWTL